MATSLLLEARLGAEPWRCWVEHCDDSYWPATLTACDGDEPDIDDEDNGQEDDDGSSDDDW